MPKAYLAGSLTFPLTQTVRGGVAGLRVIGPGDAARREPYGAMSSPEVNGAK